LIDKKFINNFKNDIYLVNTSRGEVVNEQHIKDLLLSGKIKGYATDVLQTEYNQKESQFKGLNNVIVTPHIAGVTIDAQEKAYRRVMEKI
jgi:phosphoglycerate dehydrogenase-like enzyme